MKLRLERLRELVPGIDASATEIARRLTLAGVAVERVLDPEGDPVLELEITTNRPDLLSYSGVSRELAALYDRPWVALHSDVVQDSELTLTGMSVAVEAPALCSRYSARIVREVTVAPSPTWLRREIEASGQRSINNVVDVTNFVLLELGHPLHAFDLARIRGSRVVVRLARQGERLRSLDGIDRALHVDDLVIADAERPLALAGVIGGLDSEIGDSTRDILLESAWFDPPTVRRMSRRHQLRTEASLRFERGADIGATTAAVDRAAELLHQVAGGRILNGVIDVFEPRPPAPPIQLRPTRLDQVLGIRVPPDETLRILAALGFTPTRGSTTIEVAVPSFRIDVDREIDLIEEVGRIHGYDAVPATLPASTAPPRGRSRSQHRLQLVRTLLAGAGWSEAVTLSMVEARRELAFTPGLSPLKLQNPLTDRMGVLRASLLGGLVEVVDHNLRHGASSPTFYEAAKVFDGNGNEKLNLGLATTVSSSELAATLELKGALELIARCLRLGDLSVDSDNLPARVFYRDREWGRMLRVTSEQLEAMGADPKLAVFCAEVDLGAALHEPTPELRYRAFSRFPASTRDISLWSNGASFADVAKVIRAAAGPLLESLSFLDRYHDHERKRVSLTLRLTYRGATRTLEADEVQVAHERVLTTLASDQRLALRI